MTSRSTQKTERKDKTQLAAFRKAARELGADESEGRFQDALRKIAKHKAPDGKADKRRG